MVNAKDPVTGRRTVGTLGDIPKDPWKNDYIYELREDGPLVICYGKDNSPGGEGEDRDFVHPQSAVDAGDH